MIKNMISLSDMTLIKADQLLKKSILPLLEKDQIVEAKVLQLISPSKAELLIMGKRVIAETSVSMTKGETVQLKVTEQGKLNILKVMPDTLGSYTDSDSSSGEANATSALPRLSDLALQFFTKSQPFEGFGKLATALFSKIKEPPFLQADSSDKQLADQELIKNLPAQKGAPLLDRVGVKTLPDQADKSVAGKEIVKSMLVQSDKPVADKSDIGKLLISVAVKSEKADIDFLPRLLHKSGLLLEKKLSDMVKNGSTLKDSIKRTSSGSPETPDLKPGMERGSSPSSKLSTSGSINLQANGQTTSDSAGLPENSLPLPKPEALVHEDIKGAVLNFISRSGVESPEEIKVFHEFIQNLENVQLLNSHLSESGKYIIPFPLFNGDQFSFGQLFINLGQKEKESGSSSRENSLLRVSLFLDMTRLGPVRADFSVLKNNITGGFQVSDEETAIYFRQMVPELARRLQSHDYQVHKIECRVVALEELTEKSIINELLKSEEHGFSVMI